MDSPNFETLDNFCSDLLRFLDEFQMNSAMWERAYHASFRLYNSDAEYESATLSAARALLHYQIVLLYKFWETNASRDGNKRSLPLFVDSFKTHVTALADAIAKRHSFGSSGGLTLRNRKQRQLKNLINLIESTRENKCVGRRTNYGEVMKSLGDVRNNVLAHNISGPSPEGLALDPFGVKALGTRTIRLCKCIALINNGPLGKASVGLSKSRRNSVDKFWERIEGRRAHWFR